MMSGLPIADCRLPMEFGNISCGSLIQNSKPKIKNYRAFTMIELMMVVAIIGLVMAMGIPYILSMKHEAPMRKAVNDVLEICSRARAGAIMHNTTTTVVFHPRPPSGVELEGGDTSKALSTRMGRGVVTSSQFDPSVTVEALGIDLKDYTDAEVAPIHFFPNGTCDEMTLVLVSGNQREVISLELTTGLTSVRDMK
jgi:prepilin-type N-terminal cleavage/methylation domain-containing protein